jgi:hypothetical protein
MAICDSIIIAVDPEFLPTLAVLNNDFDFNPHTVSCCG